MSNIDYNKLKEFSCNSGHEFKDMDLLARALTHASFDAANNERLEFLGDSLVNLIVAEELFNLYPNGTEGELTRLRSDLVKGSSLASVARELQLPKYLLFGGSEQQTGKYRDSILEDALEAVIAAIYLDAGFTVVKKVVINWYKDKLQTAQFGAKDPKTTLQELLQAKGKKLPVYKVIKTIGKPHKRTFVVQCVIEALQKPIQGKGDSIRKAEQAAASQALELLK